MEPAGDLGKLVACERKLAAQRLDLLSRNVAQTPFELVRGAQWAGAQLELELVPLLVGGVEQPAAEAVQLLDPHVHLAVAAGVLDRGGGHGDGGLGRRAVRDRGRVVQQRDLCPAFEDPARDGAGFVALGGGGYGSPSFVGPGAAGIVHAQLEVGVAQRVSQAGGYRSTGRRGAELDDQAGGGGGTPAPGGQVPRSPAAVTSRTAS